MNARLHLASIVALAASAGLATAQGYGPEDAPSTRTFVAPPKDSVEIHGTSQNIDLGITSLDLITPIHTAPDDPEGGAYGIWAAGKDYKVSFHGDPTFIPYLGSEYPHNQPLTWTTLSVTAGDTTLMQNGDGAERVSTATRYEYRYAAVTEAYDVRLEGLEQTFVIAERPATPGDIVVIGRFSSLMKPTAEFANAHRSIDFADENGTVLVNYGEAFVFDASGHKVAIDTSVIGDTITLTVPRSYLADATFPVTIDPLTTPSQINSGADIIDADVARDDGTNGTCATYCRSVSATDADCWGWTAADGLPSLTNFVFSDITSSWSTPDTSCANVGNVSAGDNNRYVIAIQRVFSSTSAGIRLWNQATSTTTQNNLVVAVTIGNHNSGVDVGGIERFNEGGNFSFGEGALVAFQRDVGGSNTPTSDIYAVFCTLDGSSNGVTVGSDISVAVSATRDSESPSVTKVSGGDPGTGVVDWMVGYQEYNNTIAGDDWDALATRVFSDGTTSSSNWFPSVSTGAHKIDVKIEGQRGRYLATYGRVDEQGTLTKISGLESNQIVNERFDFPVGGPITKQTEVNTSGNLGRIFRVYDNAFDADFDSIWCSVWAAPRGTGRVFVERVGYQGERLEVGNASPNPNQVLTGAGAAFDDDANDFVVIICEDQGDLYSAIMDHATEGPTPAMSGTSCSTANLAWDMEDAFGNSPFNPNSDQQIGSEFAVLTVSGAPAGAVHFMGLSPVIADFPSTGPVGLGCRTLIDPSAAGFIVLDFRVGASARWDLQLPEFLGAITIYFQDFHTGPGGLFYTTRRLEVPLAK